ncbi:MAG: hypothetical protein L6V82_05650 [Clostridiales bacterium]|nr:MAG: hypothetical protein L6V82_05650 [Clostridiales bacterium]
MSDKINKEALAAHRKKVRDDWFTIRALLKIDMKSRLDTAHVSARATSGNGYSI